MSVLAPVCGNTLTYFTAYALHVLCSLLMVELSMAICTLQTNKQTLQEDDVEQSPRVLGFAPKKMSLLPLDRQNENGPGDDRTRAQQAITRLSHRLSAQRSNGPILSSTTPPTSLPASLRSIVCSYRATEWTPRPEKAPAYVPGGQERHCLLPSVTGRISRVLLQIPHLHISSLIFSPLLLHYAHGFLPSSRPASLRQRPVGRGRRTG